MENPFIKKHGTANFEEVKEKMVEKINKNIHQLRDKEIDAALEQGFMDALDDFSVPEAEKYAKEIEREEMLKQNLENKDYYSLN